MEITIEEALKQGVTAHKAGDLVKADKMYTAILKSRPDHPDANHNLAVLAVSLGKPEEALPYFQKAIDALPSHEQFWISFIDTLIKLTKLSEASDALKKCNQQKFASSQFENLKNQLKRLSKPNTDTSKAEKKKFSHLYELYKEDKIEQLIDICSHLVKSDDNSSELHKIMGAAYSKINELDKAAKHFEKAIELKSNDPETHYNLGNILRRSKDYELALTYYDAALRIKSDYCGALYNKGYTYELMGKIDNAKEAYKDTIKFNPKHTLAHNNLGNIYQKDNLLDEAERYYQVALQLQPDFPEALNNLGTVYHLKGLYRKAAKKFEAAINFTQNNASYFFNLANSQLNDNKFHKAEKNFRKVVNCSPQDLKTYLIILDSSEKWNQLEILEDWLFLAKKNFRSLPNPVKYFEALLSLRRKKYEDALKILLELDANSLSIKQKQNFYQCRAKCYDALGNYNAASHDFFEMNSITKLRGSFKKAGYQNYIKNSKMQVQDLKSLRKYHFDKLQGYDHKINLTFLVGFPRSGTTLLDTILRTHSKVTVIEEKPMIKAAQEGINEANRLSTLENLDFSQISSARENYLKELSKYTNTEDPSQLIIDKLPLNILQLPLIHILFPDSKIIFTSRHPCDAILSCWQQNFKLNDAMAVMVDLKKTVELYANCIDTMICTKDRFNIPIHTTRYEGIISDAEAEIRNLLRFLDLDWENEILSYQKTALEREKINTPSYSQIIEPLYLTSSNKWKNYSFLLEKYFDCLRPYCEQLEYSLEI